MRILMGIALAGLASAAPAQTPAAAGAAVSRPVTVEHYYRIKWGSAEEFKRLYKANHTPLLAEMQRAGFITRIETHEPFTHMAGGVRWDLRVTLVYRDAASAIELGGAFDEAFEAAKARLYPDRKKLADEEARRFALLEEHWDVVVAKADE